MPVSISADQKVTYTINPDSIKDREGNSASVQGAPIWASSDETIASLEVSGDGMSATVLSHLAGECTIMAEADADLGDGVVTINGSDTVTVTAGRAASFELKAGDVEDK